MSLQLTTVQRRVLIAVLVFTVLVRLLTLGAYPLADTTEARYAEIARKMAETGNWVTPLEDYGVPFWAKPPLSTWLTALCFKAFGVNEFTARLSSFLLLLAIGWLTYLLARRQRGRDPALLGTVVLATTGLTFITAGAVMTDAAVALSSTLCMVAFWRAMNGAGRTWGYLFFAGLAAGLLSKGLVPIVLTFFPIGLWVLWKKQWRPVRQRLPWVTGSLLAIALSAPWYILAEIRTPGFLKYFFIGEHLGKFLDENWRGDRYGTAHGEPRGTIWVYWLASAFPWSIAFLASLLRRKIRRRPSDKKVVMDDWTAYLVCWTVAPMLFFTLAGNIMLTYVMPGLPAFGLLMAEILLARKAPAGETAPVRTGPVPPLVGMVTPAMFLAAVLTVAPHIVAQRSQKIVVREYESLRNGSGGSLVYVFHRPHSADFYTRGKAVKAGIPQVEDYLRNGEQDFFVVRNGNLAELPASVMSKLEPVWKDKEVTLLRERMNGPS